MKTKFNLLLISMVTLVACEGQPVSAAMYMFQDTTFLNSDWTATKWADTTPGASATFNSGQANTGGSPFGPNTPDFRLTRHVYNNGAIQVEHRNVNFNWTPLPGESVVDIDFQYDLRHLTGTTVGGAVGYALNLYQGGKVYRSTPYDNIFPNTWVPFSHPLVPLTSFQEVVAGTGVLLPTSNPVATLPMSFGFMSANSANQLTTKISGIDNLKITLWTVPEPACGLMALIASCFLRRLRRAC